MQSVRLAAVQINCPQCDVLTVQHENRSYYGEMRICLKCGFQAYRDQWNEQGQYEQPSDDPF